MKKYRFCRILFTVFSLFVALSMLWPGQVACATESPITVADLQTFFDQAIPEQLASLHIAGATVAVVEGGELVFTKGYGFADVEKQIPVQAETTLFRIGSISKLFTWTAVMQLVEQGKLDLDADVNTYLDFHIPDTYPQSITLRHLLAHTAGFEDRVFAYSAANPESLIPDGKWLAGHIPTRVRAPGEFTSYSNYGVALAGYMVARVAGTPYDEYVEQNILFPLEMTRTTSRQPLPALMSSDMSQGYLYTGNTFQPYAFELLNPAPAGSFTSSATDMARFMIAHLQQGSYGDGRILQEATLEQMHTRLFGHDPRLNGFAYGFYEMNQNGLRVIGHAGDSAVFHSLLALVPEHNLGLFVSYNSQTAAEAQSALLEDFLDRFFPAPETEKQTPVTLTAAELERFAGSYRQNRRYAYTTLEKVLTLLEPVSISPTEDGDLLIVSPYGEMRFEPAGPLLFRRVDNPDSLLLFQEDGRGDIAYAFASDDPTAVFEKQPWYGDFNFHYAILIITALLFLSALVIAPLRWMIGRRKKELQSQPKAARLARQILVWISLCAIAFLVGFVLAISGYVYGDTTLMNIVLALPIFMLVLTLVAVFLTLRAWREGYWNLVERVYHTLVTMAAIAFLWFVSYWNLLGWRY